MKKNLLELKNSQNFFNNKKSAEKKKKFFSSLRLKIKISKQKNYIRNFNLNKQK
jgi:hypothetical protein